MALTGVHALLYTAKAAEVRTVLRDVFGWGHVDAGDGWLIFAVPSGEMAVHPAEGPAHEITLMCDDLDATVAEFTAKGVEFDGGAEDRGWGITTTMVLPGGLRMMLYEPRHPTAV